MLSALALATLLKPAYQAPWVIGMAQLSRLDLLPAFRRSVSFGAVTSYDRSGGNDDGFSGKYSFVRKEAGGLVLADLKGPGCIYRIHTPSPTDDPLEFYFDGESKPRISTTFRKLYEGKLAPFVRPLVDCAGGGYTSYVPIPYAKSCKILLRAKSFQFYDLNYATYPAASPVASFNPSPTQADWRDIHRATALFSADRSRNLTSYNVPPGAKTTRHPFSASLAPGKAVTLFETRKPGRIVGFRLGPSDALEGKMRDVLLRITWDGSKTPAVLCPAGDFFGYAWGHPAMGSVLLGTHAGVDYCNLPMPFDHAAKIELVSLRKSGAAVAVRGEVMTADAAKRPYEGKFYAVWRRENPTTEGKPFTYLETQGHGQIVGLALQAQGDPGSTSFFEGDDITTADGAMAVHGTGSEDSFNGGWYDVPDRWDGRFARALSGCLEYEKPLGRTGGYRFFIGDAYSFDHSILQTIEHAPEGNRGPADYCSVTYLYCDRPPTVPLTAPSAKARHVVDPTRIVFTADWRLPIASFAFNSATISRTDVPAGSGRQRCLSLRAKGEDFFGPPFIRFICDLPAPGRYKVFIDVVKGPEQGQVQLFQSETALGETVDLYSEKAGRVDHIPVGTVDGDEGGNRITLKLTGKRLGLDLIDVVFELVR